MPVEVTAPEETTAQGTTTWEMTVQETMADEMMA